MIKNICKISKRSIYNIPQRKNFKKFKKFFKSIIFYTARVNRVFRQNKVEMQPAKVQQVKSENIAVVSSHSPFKNPNSRKSSALSKLGSRLNEYHDNRRANETEPLQFEESGNLALFSNKHVRINLAILAAINVERLRTLR